MLELGDVHFGGSELKWGKYHFSGVGRSNITSNTSSVHLSESKNRIGEFKC